MTALIWCSLAVALATFAGSSAYAQEAVTGEAASANDVAAPNTAPVAAPVTAPVPAPVATPSDLSVVRVALPNGFSDEASYAQSVLIRVDGLELAAQRSEGALAKTEMLLAAANTILATALESACTRRLLQLDDGQPQDSGDITALLDRADTLLESSDTSLRELASKGANESGLPEDDGAGGAEELSSKLDTIRAFSQALRAHLPNDVGDGADPGADAARSARAAASALSPLLEDRDPGVAASARFWQAVLRSTEDDLTPALSILGSATTALPEGSMPYAFFSRLLRCRLLADQGGWAVALTLLMQIEERCNDWFSGDVDRDRALRTCALVRIQILDAWRDRLPSDTAEDERKWCVDRISRLRGERFGGDDTTVLRLSPAVPVLAIPPEVGAAPPDDSARPGQRD